MPRLDKSLLRECAWNGNQIRELVRQVRQAYPTPTRYLDSGIARTLVAGWLMEMVCGLPKSNGEAETSVTVGQLDALVKLVLGQLYLNRKDG